MSAPVSFPVVPAGSLDIDLVGDFSCPWSFLGTRRLARALEHLQGVSVRELRWHPLRLKRPEAPAPRDWRDHLATRLPKGVSVEFAEGHARVWPYPYPQKGSIRHEVFSRRGGVYFGIANLLHYRASYPQMLYRFADYNAGRYSSRNAAFQAALARLGKQKLALDGDLLRYEQGRPAGQQSGTEQALRQMAGRLGLDPGDIRADLQQEKTERFSQTRLFRRVFELAEQQAGRLLPRETLPQIRLQSPKITRKLTTEWFAKRVDGRYQSCLQRAPQPRS